eukprot:4839391-Prymnesium_polylepis.1
MFWAASRLQFKAGTESLENAPKGFKPGVRDSWHRILPTELDSRGDSRRQAKGTSYTLCLFDR